MKMVRQRPRKSVEELYTTKFEANPLKSQVNSNNHNHNNTNIGGTNNNKGASTSKNCRTERDYAGCIISSGTPYGTVERDRERSAPGPSHNTGATSMATSRRRTARTTHTAHTVHTAHTSHNAHNAHTSHNAHTAKSMKDDKNLPIDDGKREHMPKGKTSRPEKCSYVSAPPVGYNTDSQFGAFMDLGVKETNLQPGGHHHHHSNHGSHDDDKDDDTEEFFELIRHTVESAIGKSISDLLNRNFRELSAKVDRFSSELKSTNQLLTKLQNDMNNKVVHYGEENSRHFRYLCMKSEYDKMFYQHHTMMVATPNNPNVATAAAQPSTSAAANAAAADKRAAFMKTDCDKLKSSCMCRGASKPGSFSEPQKSSSEEPSVSQKSSEMGMREVLEHIQRFCTQMQLNELKSDEPVPKSSHVRLSEAMKINKHVFDVDDDDFQLSSDGMTPRSEDQASHGTVKYSASSLRNCNTNRMNNGGGDA